MRFEDITQEWVDNNKEMLHQYFFDYVITNISIVTEKYIGADDLPKPNWEYHITYYRYEGWITIIFDVMIDNYPHGMVILGDYNARNYNLGDYNVRNYNDMHSLDFFIEFMREKKLNQLV